MRPLSRITALGLKLLLVPLAFTLLIENARAEKLSDADWISYFGAENANPMEFKISMTTPFGPQEFTQRVKPKGTVSIRGKEYRESIVLHDSGPFANKIIKTLVRVSDDGLYERREDGSESLLFPRPLTTNQTWTNGKETYKFEGIEDFETFDTTVPACLKISVLSQEISADGKASESRDTKYYERGKGLIYKSGNNGIFEVTKILSGYAASKRDR